ncbi:MAG: HD domain-containing protein [Lentisphaerae bacterium]|jgi:tRNA nucleotidyltransferase (CCA-adding enzyme)|nr:HD domain-containing protein [Lentisphaerota bacterium]
MTATDNATVEQALNASPYISHLLNICHSVNQVGGTAILVGGSVRDALYGIAPKDLDIEVYNIDVDTLTHLLEKHYCIDFVGRSFGVFKIHHHPIDISLPRLESKSGHSHKDFTIKTDPNLSIAKAARRRDFTINSLSYDPLQNTLHDPYNGVADLKAGILRHTSTQFAEDPLRVLRGMQLAARLDLTPALETIAICSTLTIEHLSVERVFEEWKKLILKGIKPSRGLAFLRECGWLSFFPELAALIGCEQEPEWHPEGDVWIHTLHSMDAFAAHRCGDEWEDLIVGLAVLCHDLGKPATTCFERGRIRSAGHEEAGADPTRSFLSRMTNQKELIDQVVALVTHHLRPQMLHEAQSSDSAIRRLANKVRIDRLVRVSRADMMGRPPIIVDHDPAGEWLLQRAQALQVEANAAKPLVLGRHLLAAGYQPGAEIGALLKTCYEAQLDGLIATTEEGLSYIQKHT